MCDWLVRSAKSRGSWVVVSVVAVVLLGVFLSGYHWDWLSQQDAPSAIIRNVGLVIAALVALILAVWRSIVAQEQADTARRSLLEERYQKAAAMLGSELLPVRLGGIDGLCRLARDYPKEFHLQVLGLLSAFVRYPPPIPVEIFGVTEDGHPRTPVPREEVQTILVFLGGTAEQRCPTRGGRAVRSRRRKNAPAMVPCLFWRGAGDVRRGALCGGSAGGCR